MPYNVWSGTDYLKNMDGMTTSPTIESESSLDWSSNHERSIKITSTVEGYAAIYFPEATGLTPSETLQATIKILNNSGKNCQLRLMENENGTYNSVDIVSNVNPQKITISRTISTTSLQIIIILRVPELTVYIDDVQLTAQ